MRDPAFDPGAELRGLVYSSIMAHSINLWILTAVPAAGHVAGAILQHRSPF